ncbi:MAG: hypothetical protein JXN61_03205, partial [Sedimentisphaerales bacterium]|nr:hypothetical protein [Sedimentisphaerales bacterium]
MSGRVIWLAAFALLPALATSLAHADDPNLIAWYEFEGDLSDSSDYGNHGTAVATVTFTSDPERGQVAQLGDGYVEVGVVGISGAQPRTIAGWAKADTTSMPSWANIFGFTGPSATYRHFDIEYMDLGYPGYGIHINGWERIILPVDSEWHHLAASYDDGQVLRWYGDGVEIGNDGGRTLNTTDNVHLGKRSDSDAMFSGRVDDVRIYAEALDGAEIAALAMRFKAHDPDPSDGQGNADPTTVLTWNAGGDVNSHDVYFGTDRDALPKVATKDVGDESYDPPGELDYCQTYYWKITEVNDNGVEYEGPVWQFTVQCPLPAGWSSQDIGTTGGYALYNAGTWTVTADGEDIWGESDEFHYVYQILRGDGQMVARVVDINGPGTHEWRKAGVMIRESLAGDSKHAYIAMTPGSGHEASFMWRSTTDNHGVNGTPADYTDLPYWVKIVREGNTYSAYHSPDGIAWTQQGESQTFDMASEIYVGMAVTSHESGILCTATFDNVRIMEAAGNPSPENNSLGVPTVLTLGWEAGLGAAWHEVWFGTDPNALEHIATNPAGEVSYDVPALDYCTKYYWRIVEVNDPDTWGGETWTFETEADPSAFQGRILREWWFVNDDGDGSLDSLKTYPDFPDNPDGSELINSFEGPTNWGEEYGSRIHGWL